MTYLEGIAKECARLGIPFSLAPRLYAALLPLWFGHFVLGEKISDARIYEAAR